MSKPNPNMSDRALQTNSVIVVLNFNQFAAFVQQFVNHIHILDSFHSSSALKVDAGWLASRFHHKYLSPASQWLCIILMSFCLFCFVFSGVSDPTAIVSFLFVSQSLCSNSVCLFPFFIICFSCGIKKTCPLNKFKMEASPLAIRHFVVPFDVNLTRESLFPERYKIVLTLTTVV